MSELDLSARTLLVTGVSRGIGHAVAQRLINEGAKVIGISRTPPPTGLRLDAHHAVDLAQLDALPRRLQEIARSHRDIDGVIFNAGKGRFGALEQFSAVQVRQLVDLNLTSQILLARQFLPLLKKKQFGDLIYIGSEAALSGGRNGAVYAATKFALRGMTQSLREECAHSGVRVGIVNPGMVDTDFFEELAFRPGAEKGEHLTVDDVAEAVMLMLNARPGAVIDEISLSPQKKVIRFGEKPVED
ncbi:MAG: SDR family oxidoreductase [Pseudomonadota bacterium]